MPKIKDKKLLQLSKVIKNKENFEYLDIYCYFLERLKKELCNNTKFQNLKISFNCLVTFSKILKHSIIITLDKRAGFSQYYLSIENITFQKWRKVTAENKKGYV